MLPYDDRVVEKTTHLKQFPLAEVTGSLGKKDPVVGQQIVGEKRTIGTSSRDRRTACVRVRFWLSCPIEIQLPIRGTSTKRTNI